MAFDVTFVILTHSLVVTPLSSPLQILNDVESLTNRNHLQKIRRESKTVVEKSEEREVIL